MSKQLGAYARGTLPGLKELFRQLPPAVEKLDRILEIKIKNMATGALLHQTKKAIEHNMDTKPMAPSTALFISTLFAACEDNHKVIGELLDEIERLRLLQ